SAASTSSARRRYGSRSAIQLRADLEPGPCKLGAAHDEQRTVRLLEQAPQHRGAFRGERAVPAKREHARGALAQKREKLVRRVPAAEQYFVDAALLPGRAAEQPPADQLLQPARELVMRRVRVDAERRARRTLVLAMRNRDRKAERIGKLDRNVERLVGRALAACRGQHRAPGERCDIVQR